MMKQNHFDLLHQCQSTHIRNHGYSPSNFITHPCRLYNRCDGTCFRRSFYPSCFHGRMPYPCHPVVHCPCNHAYQPETVKIKEKSRDPSSYWVTVRRITPLHVAMAATEAYQTQKSRDSTMILSSPKCRNIQTKSPHEHAKDQSSPSVPSKKLVKRNNGIQPSSTSFATVSAEQSSETNSEQFPFPSPTFATIKQSRIYHLPMSNIDAAILDETADSSVNKQIEARHHMQTSSNNPRSTIDKEESPTHKFSRHRTTNEHENNRSPSSIGTTDYPVLPSSLAPNIHQIKSNEMLVHTSRSNKSLSRLNTTRQKSLTSITRSNTSLHTTRSTLDFGFLLHETNT